MNCWSCGKEAHTSTCPSCERKLDMIRRDVEGIHVYRGRRGKVIVWFSIEPETSTHNPDNGKE